MGKLAINGGQKVRTKPFPAYNTIGKEEEEAALKVLRSGKLSTFLGTWHHDFYGGKEIRLLETTWAEFFNVKYAISVNSATSGLFMAVGAAGLEPGDEMIVTPYTMSASAVAAIIYGAIPVFADIEEDFFCLDVQKIEEKITSKTKAIMVVDIFGQPYDADAVNALAKKYGLTVIEDAAQAPGAKYKDKYAGTLGDIGVYSLNYHKHIHCGEGGIVVTDSDELAQKLYLIRNHAEAVLDAKGIQTSKDLVNMVGFNYRLSELHAAIAYEQLNKLPGLIQKRQENVQFFEKAFDVFDFLDPAKTRNFCEHAFYVHPVLYHKTLCEGIDRNTYVKAVKAELPRTLLRDESDVLISYGYVKPLYLQPMYQQRIAFGSKGYPFNLTDQRYETGMCPVTEKLHFESLITHEMIRPGMGKDDMKDVIDAFAKVYENRSELKTLK